VVGWPPTSEEDGSLRPLTRSAGLSLGDRACLALAARLGAWVLTADSASTDLPIDVKLQPIR
jgi:ribonuclease VapC